MSTPPAASSGLPPRKPPPSAALAGGGGLPPKPSSFRRQSTPNRGVGERRASLDQSSNSQNSSSSSPNRRAALQKDVSKRLLSLTLSEANFLQQIIVHGTEEEVEIAHTNLMDEDLFGPVAVQREEKAAAALDNDNHHHPEGGQQQQQQAKQAFVAQAWLRQDPNREISGASEQSNISSLRSSTSTTTQNLLNAMAFTSSQSSSENQSQQPPHAAEYATLRSVNSGMDSVGSERRQERLQQRREHNQVWDQIWHAHESGLAVTKQASRRSISRNSLRFAGTNARSSSIFRRGSRSGSAQPDMRRKSYMDSSNSSGARSVSGGPAMPPRKPSLRRLSSDTAGVPGKPALHRMLSDSSRKSVTFDMPRRDASQRSLTEFQRRSLRSTRSGSFGSVPSLHRAHPLRSNSIASQSSVGSFPILPHVRAMRSNSFGSHSVFSGSSYYNYDGRNPSNDAGSSREEKKVEDLWPSVPTKVEIRKEGIHQVQDSTKYMKRHPLRDELPMTSSEFREESTSSEYFALADDSEMFSKSEEEKLPPPPIPQPSFQRPVLMRDVSIGEGVEVADFAEQAQLSSPSNIIGPSYKMDGGDYFYSEDDLQMANSFDETMSFRRMNDIFRRPIKRSLSDEGAAVLFAGQANILRESVNTSNKEAVPNDGDSWQMDDDEELDYYDSWLVIEDEYENGYGGGGTLPFQIIGTSANDRSAQPHVLSPPLMESLQQFLPFALTGENFWLKYSMVRDGASMHTFLKHARNARSTILAIETTDGEVFGAFTSESWRKNWNYFGTGESFLWRMRHNRGEKARSIIDQASRESELEVFPFTGENNHIQYCTNTRLAVGGGAGLNPSEDEEDVDELGGSEHTEIAVKEHDWGYGLTIQGESLLQGTSSPCLTFGSPSLSKMHSDGSLFEIMNMELWTLTPCYNLDEAEKLELGKLFLEKYRKN